MSWHVMNDQPRIARKLLCSERIPVYAGVYAWYLNGKAVYVGKADCLRQRIWENHCRTSLSMTNSAFRRNVAEHLRIASAADIKLGRHKLSAAEVTVVNAWIDRLELAWIACPTPADALGLEKRLKVEWRPPLTKQ